MKESVEKSGRTVDEAVRKALEELGLTRAQVSVEILEEKRGGLFGLIPSRGVRVRVTPKQISGMAAGDEPARMESTRTPRDSSPRQPRARPSARAGQEPVTEEDASLVLSVVEELLKTMGFKFEARAGIREGGIDVRVDTVGMDGLLIGQKGQTLASLQHVVSRIAAKKAGRVLPSSVDVGGYLERRFDLLREKALRIAKEVRQTGEEFDLEPLSPRERRIVHVTLNTVEGVRTYTVGDGPLRRIVISPDG